jgi:hypothetical protein
MATRMADRLDDLYVAAAQRDAALMHANAVSACSRWCTAQSTHAQVTEFTQRQIGSLEGLNDSLSCEIRDGWQWLAGEIGPAPALAPEPARLFRFANRRETVTGGVSRGLRVAA